MNTTLDKIVEYQGRSYRITATWENGYVGTWVGCKGRPTFSDIIIVKWEQSSS